MLEGKALAMARHLRVQKHFSPDKIAAALQTVGHSTTTDEVRKSLGLDVEDVPDLAPQAQQIMDYMHRKRSITVADAVNNLDMKKRHVSALLRELVGRGLVKQIELRDVSVYEPVFSA